MQTCPECGGEARDTHSFCPECRTPLSAAAKKTGSATGGSEGGSGSDDGLLGGESSVSRRNLLLYGGAAVGTAAVGGGAGFLLLSGGGSGPAAAARSFVEALDAGNVEEAKGMLHSDSPLQSSGLEFAAGIYEQADISIDATEVVSENGTDAEVRVETTATLGGETQTDAAIITMRKQGGDWRVVNFE